MKPSTRGKLRRSPATPCSRPSSRSSGRTRCWSKPRWRWRSTSTAATRCAAHGDDHRRRDDRPGLHAWVSAVRASGRPGGRAVHGGDAVPRHRDAAVPARRTLTLLTTLTLYCLARFGKGNRYAWLYAAGAVLGLAFLSKETAIVFIAATYAFLALVPELFVRLRHLAIAMLTMGLVIACSFVSGTRRWRWREHGAAVLRVSSCAVPTTTSSSIRPWSRRPSACFSPGRPGQPVGIPLERGLAPAAPARLGLRPGHVLRAVADQRVPVPPPGRARWPSGAVARGVASAACARGASLGPEGRPSAALARRPDRRCITRRPICVHDTRLASRPVLAGEGACPEGARRASGSTRTCRHRRSSRRSAHRWATSSSSTGIGRLGRCP